jgi:hypothetical protein
LIISFFFGIAAYVKCWTPILISNRNWDLHLCNKAYEKFEKGKAKTTVEAKPKEGVTSERFESKY